MTRALGLTGVVAALVGCATSPPPSTPTPRAPTTVEVAPTTAHAEPTAIPAASTTPLPRHLMLEDAASLVVFDVAALRALGLSDTLRLATVDAVGAAALPCVEPLIATTQRVIVTASHLRGHAATVIEQPEAVEPILDCFAARIPSATAKPIGERAGLEIRPGTVAIAIDHTLVLGNETALMSLLDVPTAPPSASDRPSRPATPDDQRRGDVLHEELDQLVGSAPGLDALIAELPSGAGTTLVTAVQNMSGSGPSLGSSRAIVQVVGGELHAHLDFIGFGEQMAMIDQLDGAGGEPMIERIIGNLRSSIVEDIGADEQATPLVAALDRIRLEQRGADMRISLDVPDVAPLVTAVERVAAKKRTEGEDEEPKSPIAPSR